MKCDVLPVNKYEQTVVSFLLAVICFTFDRDSMMTVSCQAYSFL